jgi:hypothetical protein
VLKSGYEDGYLPQRQELIQLAAVKFLLELLGFERSDDEDEKPEQDSLALFLLKQLGLPTEARKEDEDEAPLRLESGGTA